MKKYFCLILIVYCFLFFIEKINFKSDQAKLIIFSVGQGDAALLVSPKGKTLLIDGGPNKIITNKIGRVFKKRKKTIDYLVLSHAHSDHYIGLLALSDYYHFENAILATWTDNDLLINWSNDLEEKNTQIMPQSSNLNRYYLEEDCYFDVLASPLLFTSNKENVSENNLSFSLKIDCYGIEALFTGDLEEEGEESLIKKAPKSFLSSQIFQAGHHGSDTSNNIEFLNAVNPDLFIVSVGEDNRHGHPGEKTLNNISKIGAEVFRTDIVGDIKILSNNKEISVETEN